MLEPESTPEPRPGRGGRVARRVATAILVPSVVTVMIWPIAVTNLAAAEVAEEEARIRAEGVKVTATLEFETTDWKGRDSGPTDEVRATYERNGMEYTVTFYCDSCRGVEEITMWVDPDDSNNFVSDYASEAEQETEGVAGPGFLALGGGFLFLFFMAVRWRWWLAMPKSTGDGDA